MTVSSTTNRNSFTCTGVKEFPFDFKIFAKTDLVVILRDSEGSETTLILTTDYTISAGPWETGGTVTTVESYTSGTLVIIRELPQTQGMDYVENDPFPADTHEQGLDRGVMILQELTEKIARMLILAKSSSYSDLRLPDPVASKLLAWKDDLSGIKNVEIKNQGDLSVTDYIKTLLDDEDATVALATLGLTVSAYIKTLLDDADAAAARVTLGDILRKSFADVYAIASGTDTYIAALSPTISSYETGAHYLITFTNANTIVDPTLNLNTLGAKTIKKEGGSALVVGDIPNTHASILKYDGTDIILLNPNFALPPDGTITKEKLSSPIKPWILLGEQEASDDATIDFTSLITSAYDEYIFLLAYIIPVTNGSDLLLRYSDDNGSTWKSGGNDYFQIEAYYTSIKIASSIEGSSPAIGGVSGEIHLMDPNSTTKYVKTYGITTQLNSASVEGATLVSGIYMGAMAVNAIRFLMSAGNISSGNFKLFGLLK